MPPLRRTTARKSVMPLPLPAIKFSASNSRQLGRESLTTSNNASFVSQLEKALADRVSPAPDTSSVSCAAAGEAPPSPGDVTLEARPKEEAGSVPSSAEMEDLLGDDKVDYGVFEHRLDSAVDDRVKKFVVDDNGGREKTMVKKKVKVVKKIKRKVIKKVPKERIGGQVGDLVENLNPNPTIPCVAEDTDLKKKDGWDTQVRKDVLTDVDENAGHCWLDNGTDVEEGECVYEDGELAAAGHDQGEEELKKGEILVGGFDEDAKEEDIRKMFARAGEIVELRLVKDNNTGKNNGFAFVLYATMEEAEKAQQMFPNVKICGKQFGAMCVEKSDSIFLDIERQKLPRDMMGDLSRDEENVRHVQVHESSKVAWETLAEVTEMKLGPSLGGSHTNIAQPSTPSITLVDSIDGSRTKRIIGDTSGFSCSSEGKRAAEYDPRSPPPKRSQSVTPVPQISSEPICKDKPQKIQELNSQRDVSCPSSSTEQSSKIIGQKDIHASRSNQLVGESEASTLKAPAPAPAPAPALVFNDYSTLSPTALKARVVSLEKQRLDALTRAIKAKEAKTEAEKSREALKEQLQETKHKIKALRRNHKDEIKDLKRKHRAALKKAEDRSFKKGKRYQLEVMKEALAFFDAKFRFEDFTPCLECIEEDRRKSLETAARQVRLEAEQFASRSRCGKVVDGQQGLEEEGQEQLIHH